MVFRLRQKARPATKKKSGEPLPFTDRPYQVSNLGRIKAVALKQEKLLNTKQFFNRVYIDLKVSGRRKRYCVHRLVAELFVPHQIAESDVVRHLNGDTSDNRAENLEWISEATARKNLVQLTKETKNPDRKAQ